jgi:hypothetical protein
MDFGLPETPDGGAGGRDGGRVRSLSATLHDIFGSGATRKANSMPQTDTATPTGEREGGGGNEER